MPGLSAVGAGNNKLKGAGNTNGGKVPVFGPGNCTVPVAAGAVLGNS